MGFSMRTRKASFGLCGIRFPLPLRTFVLLGAFACLIILAAMFGPLRFITESDEQFLERQRLVRRMKDLARLRAERIKRRRAVERSHAKRSRSRRKTHRKDRQSRTAKLHKLLQHDTTPNEPDKLQEPEAAPQKIIIPPQSEVVEQELQSQSSTRVQRHRAKDSTADSHAHIRTHPRGKQDTSSSAQHHDEEDPRNPTSELEVYWDEDASLTRICRIRRACVARDGAVVVPRWMKSRMEAFEACGLFTIRTMKSDDEWNATGAYSDFDLFGILPLRYHIPHFVTDLLPFLYANEVVRPTFSSINTKHRICYRDGGRSCNSHHAKEKLNIALYTENRVANMQSDAWVPMLVSMIEERPHLAFPKTIFEGGDLACFRSVVAYSPHSYVRPWRGWYGPKHSLFARNHISRNSVIRNPASDGVCNVQLTILNRFGWIRRGGYLVGRDITNVEDIMSELEKAQKLRRGRLKLEVSVEYFENTDFREQVSIVQKADVILGVHGAGLGNLLFAKIDVPFVEVFPFGYYAGPFDRLAEALNLKYRYVVAEPDTENFYECIAKRSRQSESPQIETKGKEVWATALKDWNNGDTRVLHAHEFNSELMSPIKLCARSQRMTLRAKNTAKLLVDLAEGICRRRS